MQWHQAVTEGELLRALLPPLRAAAATCPALHLLAHQRRLSAPQHLIAAQQGEKCPVWSVPSPAGT